MAQSLESRITGMREEVRGVSAQVPRVRLTANGEVTLRLWLTVLGCRDRRVPASLEYEISKAA